MAQQRTRLGAILLLATLSVCLGVKRHHTQTHRPGQHSASTLCKGLQDRDPHAPTGSYLFTVGHSTIEVWCEFGLCGGGWSIFNLQSIGFNDSTFKPLVGNFSEVLVLLSTKDGPKYSCVRNYDGDNLGIFLNSNQGFQTPVQRNIMGTPYLFVGFIPPNITDELPGLTSNGQDVICGRNTSTPISSSWMSFFANYREAEPAPVTQGVATFNPTTCCTQLFSSFKPVPSGRTLPSEFSTFLEMNFGGAFFGCHYQTSAGSRAESGINAASLGFR